MKKLVALCLMVGVLCGFVGCGGKEHKPEEKIYRMTYKIMGNGISYADIEYMDQDGTKYLSGVEIPWEFSFDARKDDYVYARASFYADNNSKYINILILKDNEMFVNSHGLCQTGKNESIFINGIVD